MATAMNNLTAEILARFPEINDRVRADGNDSPDAVMRHLFAWVREQMQQGRFVDIAPRVVDFTDWCEAGPQGDPSGADIAAVYAEGFYERLFAYEETRPLVTRLTTRESLLRPSTRDYLIDAVGKESFDATLAEFDRLPPSIRLLWAKARARRYPWKIFVRVLGGLGLLLVLLWMVFMVPEIRGFHAYTDLTRGKPVPLRKLVINRPEHWVIDDEASLRYITAYLKRRIHQQVNADDFPATGTLIFGPWQRVSYVEFYLSPDYDYLLVMHDDFGQEYYYRVPIRENTPQRLRGMVYGLAELSRAARDLQPPPPPEDDPEDNRIKLPGRLDDSTMRIRR